MRRLAVEIRAKHVRGPKGKPLLVLRDVAFSLALGEVVALVGPSGCGKTTLLNIIAGLDADFDGGIRLDGEGGGNAAIGYVFQEPRLLPWRTVLENVALVMPPGADPAMAGTLLAEMGIADFAGSYPGHLSLGMARRVAIARALAASPELLLMDEPLVSLDTATSERLRLALPALWRARPCAVLIVTHDLREAVELADRVLLLSPAPGSLAATVEVALPRERRTDRAAVDAVCAEIAAAQRRTAPPVSLAQLRQRR